MTDLHDPSYPLPPESGQLWETNAKWWQDAFTGGADPEYQEQIIPLLVEQLRLCSPGRVLDIGCGEGQLGRAVLASGVAGYAAGLDPTWSQLEVAVQRQAPGKPIGLTRAEAAAIPFPDQCFDAAFACLVFEHIEDAHQALAEVGRVVRPGGAFLLFLNHPLLQAPGSGWVDDQILGEQYWRIGPYLVEHHSVEEVAKNVWIPFIHRPLSFYINALAAAGLYTTAMLEPAPPDGFLERAEEYQEATAFPRLLMLRAEKLDRPEWGHG
jgi:ubiquinone/menaquinone biosynthesis C-methylase UbiE